MHRFISELYRYIHAETINQELGFLGLLLYFLLYTFPFTGYNSSGKNMDVREGILMYDLKMLEEIKSQEERIHFSSFDYNDAYTLGTMLRERGLTTPKPIAIRIVFDDIILYQSFLPGTDESNNQWMNRKQHTVERCHTSSLRAAVERELNGVKENWQQDESHYAFCGGGFPIIVNDEFRGVAMISGLPHLEDHRNLVE